MQESTHLLSTEQHAAASKGNASLLSKLTEKTWWQNSIHTVMFSGHSTDDKKRHKLLAGNVGAAAHLIRDAVIGDDYMVEDPSNGAYNPFSSSNSNFVIRNETSKACRKYCSSWTTLRVLNYAVIVLIILTFLEPPHWCRNYRLNMISMDGQQQEILLGSCDQVLRLSGKAASNAAHSNTMDSYVVEYYPNTYAAVWLSVSQSHLVEIMCLSIITLVILLRIGRDGCSIPIYLRRSAGAIQWNRMCQMLCIITLFVGVCLEHTTYNEKFTLLHPYIRLILLYSFLGGIQRDVKVLFGMLPDVFNILFLLFVLMLFYAWFGVVMFVDTPEGDGLFPTLVEGLWTLWICVTTANYPDVMMPGYNQNRFVSLYFVSFMIMTYFFLMNVILATVCNEYDTYVKEHQIERSKISSKSLKAAFSLLTQEENESINRNFVIGKAGTIERETVLDLLWLLNHDFPEFRRLSEDETHILFAILDRDGTSRITEEEFMNFGSVLTLELHKTSDYASMIEVYFPKLFHSHCWQQFRQLILAPYFEHIIDCILMLNAIVVAIQSWPLLSEQKVVLNSKLLDGSIDTIWEVMETVFTVVYGVEATCKISVYGWRTYCGKIKNVFDFTITILAIVSTIVIYYPNDYSDSRLIRMILSARVLRLIRVLTALQPFQHLGKITAVILPAAKNVIIVLFITMYFFAVLGMHLYGGMITRDPRNQLSFLLLNSDFSTNEYWANNFNDMIGGLNVLFNLLVVNNWQVCEEGFEAVTQAKWVRFFFFSFHVIGVVLVNNLVIALIINKFLQQMAHSKHESRIGIEHIGQSVHIGEDSAVFDASKVTGTVTNVSGDYIARFRQSSSDIDEEHRDRERFRTLFTQS